MLALIIIVCLAAIKSVGTNASATFTKKRPLQSVARVLVHPVGPA